MAPSHSPALCPVMQIFIGTRCQQARQLTLRVALSRLLPQKNAAGKLFCYANNFASVFVFFGGSPAVKPSQKTNKNTLAKKFQEEHNAESFEHHR